MDDDSGTTCAQHHDWRRAIRGRHAGSVFSLVWLAFPIAGLATSSPSPLRVALVAGGASAFAAIYLRALWDPFRASARGIAPPGIALAALATALTLADRPSWSLLFVLIGTMTSLTLPERRAPGPLIGCAALAVVTGVLAGDDGNAVTIAATTIGIGILMMGFARLVRSNGSSARRATKSRAWPSPRSACASRATCTTCSATASR